VAGKIFADCLQKLKNTPFVDRKHDLWKNASLGCESTLPAGKVL